MKLTLGGNKSVTINQENLADFSLDNLSPFEIFNPTEAILGELPDGTSIISFNLKIVDVHAIFNLPSLIQNPFPEETDILTSSEELQALIAHKQKYTPSKGYCIEMSFFSFAKRYLSNRGLVPDTWNKISYEYFYNLGNLPHYQPIKSPYFTIDALNDFSRSEPIGVLISGGTLGIHDYITLNIVWSAEVECEIWGLRSPRNISFYQGLINFVADNPVRIVPARPGRASLFLLNKGSEPITIAPTEYGATNGLGPQLLPNGSLNLKCKSLRGNLSEDFQYFDNFLFVPTSELWGSTKGNTTLGILEYFFLPEDYQ